MKSSRCYLDTSVLFKRYFKEKGQEEIHTLTAQADELVISELGVPELFAAFRRLVREKKLTEYQYAQAKQVIGEDLNSLVILPVNTEIVRQAIHCLEKVALQGADSVHVATALTQNCDLFISADQQQCAAAKKLGLNVQQI